MSRSLENILSNHFNFKRKSLATINVSHLHNLKFNICKKKSQIRLRLVKVHYQI